MTATPLVLLAEGASRTTFEWAQIQSNTDWIAPIGVFLAILVLVWQMYRRDSAELRRGWRWFLAGLRLATFLGLLALYLQPHWRTEREQVRNSRAVILVDTSLSMGFADPDGPGESRSRQVAEAFKHSDFLARLRKVHDVAVYEFDEDLKRDRALTLAKLPPAPAAQGELAGGDSPIFGEQKSGQSPAQKSGQSPARPAVDWAKRLAPAGMETRIGQALRQVIEEERGTPLSGIILISDGSQNAGVSPDSAVELAQEAKVPVYAIGLGSARQPAHVAVSDLAVPARALPGDHYSVTGYLQAQGMAGKSALVELWSRPAESAGRRARPSEGKLLDSRSVTLGGDGEVLPVRFEMVPEALGRYTLTLRVQPPPGDRSGPDKSREADIEIVNRKNQVLLLADGPMREYQYLRNQLFRDHSTAVDVLLQSGRPGMSQDARRILDDFPNTREEMFGYDCVVACDPNWQLLKPSQLELLEKWVAEQAGGLIVMAGPVNACRGPGGWVQDRAMTIVRNLYPVVFPGRLASVENSVYSTREPWPLQFTREGLDADFLWLADTAVASRAAWASFPGVFSFCPVRGPKPAATVYARFSDPRAAQADRQPVYFAGQYYGAGTVFYLGSAEMWRLRTVDPAYLDQFYTKLIRHVSQGRLLRGSTRGSLLVGQDRYMLGSTVEIRAQLTDARLRPLRVKSVNLQVIQPDKSAQTVALVSDPGRPGSFAGQLAARMEGSYLLELVVPESANERLSRRIQVRVPDLERENPSRNDALLSAIANGTGGKYYVGMSSALGGDRAPPLAEELRDRTTTAVLPVAPDPRREETWLRWSMIVLCGLLCLEWLVRRLLRLA
jgi:hypothetical protein